MAKIKKVDWNTRDKEDKIKNLMSLANYAFRQRSHGYFPRQLEDDFAQFYVMKIVCENRQASANNLLTDFLRSEYGENRCENGRLKSQPKFDLKDYHKICYQPEKIDIPFFKDDRKNKIIEMILEDYSFTEIANHFGISKSRINQIMKKIKSDWKILNH